MAAATRAQLPLKVLVVEDNRDARTTLRMLLALAHGCVVYEAAEGLAAIRIANDERPDLALVDLGLPGIDGYEVARRIRSTMSASDILLVALTGYGDDEDRVRTHAAGFDLHLVKPIDTAALGELLIRRASAATASRG